MEFNNVPAIVKVPLFYAEFNSSNASQATGKQPFKGLLIGQMTSAGSATANTPVKFASESKAISLFGRGSMLHLMAKAFLKNNPVTELWALPLADQGGSTAASGTLTLTGPATASGTISLYVAGQLVEVGVSSGDSANTIAAAINSAVNAALDLPVTSAVSTNVVTLTAKNKGTLGNGIDLRLNYSDGDATPTGVSVAIVAMASGATDPSMTTPIANMGETQYNVIAYPYTASTPLNALESEMEDRWGSVRHIDGHIFVSKDDTYGNLGTYGAGRNSKQTTAHGIYKSPSPSFQWAAALAGIVAYYGQIDPARPFQTLQVQGVLAPALADRFNWAERNNLLQEGISTCNVDPAGLVHIDFLNTTYQLNGLGSADASYYSLNSKLTLSYLRYSFNALITSKYPRHKLANDGTKYGPGQPIITPKVGKAEAIAIFRKWEEAGLVEDIDQFKNDLIVERDSSDVNRLNFMLPPNLINQFVVCGVSINFLL